MDRFPSHLDGGAFVRSLVAGTVVLGFDQLRRTWLTANHKSQAVTRVPELAGQLLLDLDTRTAHVNDGGYMVGATPAAVLLPACAADVAIMLRYAGDMGMRVAVRGQDDQSFGAEPEQGVDRAALLIDLGTLDKVHAVDADSMHVDAGAPWHVVVEAALRHGLTPPVLTEFLDRSVAATLAIGGLGAASGLHGAQIDNAFALEVATGAGQLLTCSAEHNRDLFEAVLGGQGQCAVITKAWLRLVRAPAKVRAITVAYASLDVLMDDLLLVRRQARFDQAHALIAPDLQGGWFYLLSMAHHFDPPRQPDEAELTVGMNFLSGTRHSADVTYVEYIHRMPRTGASSYPVIGMVLPESTVGDYVETALDLLRTKQDLVALLYSWDMTRFTRPLMRKPAVRDAVGVVMLRYSRPSHDVTERVRNVDLALFRHGREMGGSFYPINPVNMTRQDWERHYGTALEALAQAKRLYDPFNVLASGPDLF